MKQTTPPSYPAGVGASLHSSASLTRNYLKPYLGSVVVASLCSLMLGLIATCVVTLVGPCLQVLMGDGGAAGRHRLDALLGGKLGAALAALLGRNDFAQAELLIYLPLALLALALLKACFYTGQSFLWERLGELVSRDLRHDLVDTFIVLDPSRRKEAAARAKEQELSSVVSTDIKLMREYLVHFYGGLPRELLQMLFMGSTLVLLSPKLCAVFFLAVAPAVALVQKLGRKLRRRAGQALADYSLLSEWLQQRLLGVETIKHYKSESIETAKFQSLTAQLYEQFFRAARVKARTSPMIELVALVALVLVLMLALSDIASGQLTGAIAVSFFATLALFSQSASMVGRYFNSNREGAAAIERIRGLLQFFRQAARPQLLRQRAQLEEGTVLRCRGVNVQYPASAKPALEDFSYDFKAGRSYAIVGPSGAGKSSLFQAILGLQEISAGELRFASGLSADPAKLIGYMPQQVLLMNGSLADNITYPDAAGDPTRLWEALAEVQLDGFVREQPAGLAMPLQGSAVSLSGGQAQRLLLARLYYHHFPVVLVDEGTSALDPEIERHIFGLLTRLKQSGTTIIMIAHRSSAIAFADEVISLQQGRQKSADPS